MEMSILGGCEAKNRTPVLEERVCPDCGKTVEVFTVRGRLIDDFTCQCGHVFPHEEQIIPKVRSSVNNRPSVSY